jgi:hypothetical protein
MHIQTQLDKTAYRSQQLAMKDLSVCDSTFFEMRSKWFRIISLVRPIDTAINQHRGTEESTDKKKTILTTIERVLVYLVVVDEVGAVQRLGNGHHKLHHCRIVRREGLQEDVRICKVTIIEQETNMNNATKSKMK